MPAVSGAPLDREGRGNVLPSHTCQAMCLHDDLIRCSCSKLAAMSKTEAIAKKVHSSQTTPLVL